MAMGQAGQDPKLPRMASNVLGNVTQLLLNRVAGQVEVPVGPVNFRDSLPCTESNVLEPMLHPVLSAFDT